MGRSFDIVTSILATVARLGFAERLGKPGARPEKTLELYEYEGCPFCRKVREALTVLDLEAMIYPCPRKGPRFRKDVIEMGGKSQFPYLVDANTGVSMYESNHIVRYLFKTYGAGRVSLILASGPFGDYSSSLASLARLGKGFRYRGSKPPEQPLSLYNYEGSPFCRLVREVLCELEIPYMVHNVAIKSPSRPAFVNLSGKMMVPYLIDPNTETAMFESAQIVAYLRKNYGA